MAVERSRTPVTWAVPAGGIELDEAGYVKVDRVSWTNVNGIYAAGDCTGVMPLANVAAMQGGSRCGTRSAKRSRHWSSKWSAVTSSPIRR